MSLRKLAVLLLSLTVVATALPAAAAKRRSVRFTAPDPRCSMVTGTPAITFTRDFGHTLTPVAEHISGIAYTFGLAYLDTPDTLLAWHKDDLLTSTDGGCSWRVVTTVKGVEFPHIAAAKGARAYVWSDNRQFAARYDSHGLTVVTTPVAFLGFGVDPNNADHVRAGGDDGAIYDSTDGGNTWTRAGSAPSAPAVYRYTFDPKNLDHVVVGLLANGAAASFDGGKSWTKSNGVTATPGTSSNVFEIVISPADGNSVFAMGLDLAESDANLASQGRHIYHSLDGGKTFKPVVDASADVTIRNQPTMAAHPTNPNVVYWVFGTYFQNYGTDLYRYDDSVKMLFIEHNGYNDIDAIAFHPNDPNLIFFGLESEQRTAPAQ